MKFSDTSRHSTADTGDRYTRALLFLNQQLIGWLMKFILFLLFATLAAAQEKTITIIGEAELSELANRGEFTFYLIKDGKTLDGAFSNVKQKLAPIVSKLIRSGVDSNSIEQSKLYVDEKYFSLFTSNKIEATISIKVTLNDLKILEKVLGVISEAEIENLSPIKFSLKDDQPLTERTLSMAVRNAKVSAAAVAKGNNLDIGEIITVTEVEDHPGYSVAAERSYISKFGYSNDLYEFREKIILRKRVKVTFKLK